MKFGFHISIAGGLSNVVPRAQKLMCATMQLFTRSPRSWLLNRLDQQDVRDFKKALRKSNITPVFVHTPYLLNLASSNARLYKKSVNALVTDLQRSNNLGARYVIMHCGSAENAARGIRIMARGINSALNRAQNAVVLLLENTAGGGYELGAEFDQLADIIMRIEQKKRIGVVLDTAHLFAAGYDLRTRKGTDHVLHEFDSLIGLKKLQLVHLNDSKATCGSHLDRHWHIGKGTIGKGLAYVINHPSLQHLPFIMETPRMSDKDDLKNLRAAKRLRQLKASKGN
ncbi:hypothetical protein AMJ87_09685 [candidate division WOR_3 bacterium SM23_60]|uniref:Probable endonuclease 4 n=1 Tax=candidate division WOR_3 bacterium SM23_60 TaxID=1703780 RepID=A0A0S8GA11_UNCW3|nr:MAG: hypothetical protein AMJ87_09685 [candidate division WOR_3 bacterium SM23_60]